MDRRKSVFHALLFLFLFSIISFAQGPQILSPQPLSLGININITTTDKTVYAPNEPIKVTGSVFDYNANTQLSNGTIRASVVQQFSDSAYPANNNNTTTTNTAGEYTAYLTAPSTPGDYRVRINATSPTESVSGYVSLKVAAGTSYAIDLDKTAYAPGDNVTATVKVKDSTGSAVSNFTVNATLLYQNGTLYSAIGSEETGSNGEAEFSFTAPSTTGNYIFMANSLAGQTVRVIPFQVSTYVTDDNDNYKWMFAPSDNASIHAKVLDPNGNAYSATVTTAITTPSGTTTTISNFTTLATGKYKTAYTIGVEEGSYSVKTTASSGGSSVDAYTSFYVSNLYINVEKIETTGIANSSYTVTLTVKDASGNLKNGSTVNGTITSSLGALVSSYNATEDTTTKRYRISATNPADAGWYKFIVSASTDGKTASTSWWMNVQTLEIKVLTDKYKYSPGSAMSISIETKPQTTITDLSYEIRDQTGSIVGTPVTNITAGQDLNGTANISLNAPKDSGYYSLFVNVNKKAYKSTGFEVRKYNLWTETRNDTSSSSTYKGQFDNSTPVYLHVFFQTPDGGFVNLTSTISNFSYKLQRLYSYTDGKTYDAGLAFNTSYETTTATVAALVLNNSALPIGDYSVELRITDSAGSKEKAYGWFKMGGFNAFASADKWQYTSSETVNITVQAQTMNGTALANVSVRVKSSKQADTWPYVDDSLLSGTSVLNGTTDASGTARLSLAATWAYGYHQVQIEAESNGTKQQIYTGFSVQGFALTAAIDVGNILYPGQQYTITATAKSGDTPISGVNITRTEVRYANNWNLVNNTQQNFGVTGDIGSNSSTFTMPSDAKSGWYVIVIRGTKNTETHDTYIWVQVKSFDVKYYQNGQYQDWLWLGTIQPAVATPLMQVKISQGGIASNNAQIKTAYLVRTDVWPQQTINLSLSNVTNTTTDTNGVAYLSFTVPTTSKEGAQIQGGWYAIVLNVSNGGTSVLTDPWQSPQLEVRSYLIMLDFINSRGDWASSLMAGENASAQFRVEYPSNRTGVPNINVSLLAIEYANGTLYRNLTVQRPGNSTRYYQRNTTDANGNARLTLLYANDSNVTESSTPDQTGQFVLVATAGSDTFRRWFDVSSFNTKIDMNNNWEFYLDSNLTFTAHATDANQMDISGVLVNISEARSGWSWTQKTFAPVSAAATGPSGAQFNVPLSSLNITEAGDYNLRVEFTQGSTRTSQWIWFRVKKYNVQVFPTGQSFVGQALNFTVNATNSTSGITGVNATLVAIRDSWTWNILRNYSGQYNTTTGSDGIGYLSGPSNLSKGFYIAEINVSDSPTFYAWFDVRAFEVNAWTNRQAYQQGENVSVLIRITPASNATVYYTAYKPNGGQSNGSFQINGTNRDEIANNGAQLPGLTNSSGYYQLKLLVTDPNDANKYEERWISYEVRTFDAWAWLQPWQYAIGDNATANVNVYLGNNPLNNVTVSLAGISTRFEVLNGTTQSNMGLTIQLLDAGWGTQQDPTRWQPTEWASVNISNSTNWTTFTFNKTSQTDAMNFGQYTIKFDWMWSDWQNNNAPKANFRVYRDYTAPNNITGTTQTNTWGQATLNFPVQSDLKKGSYEPTIRLQYGSLIQDMPTWMEVIPFSYTAKLDKKAYNAGENATLNITATQPVNISVTGIMKWGWQPVENTSLGSATKGTLSPGQNISLNASGTIYMVLLNNITKDPWSGSSKANVSLYVNDSFNTSRELWQWNEEPVGAVIIKAMNIMNDRAEMGISAPYTESDKNSTLINFTVPSEQAGYGVGLILQNGETRIYDNIWFEVARLNVWGWTERGSYNAGDNVTLIVEARYGGTPATGLVANVTQIQKFNQSTFDWNNVNNSTTGMNATINSDGRANIVFVMADGGDYKAKVSVYAAADPSTILGTTDIWFNSRLFDAWAWTNSWDVYLGDNVTMQVSTNPAQDNASIEVYEDNMTFTQFVAIETQSNQNWDFKDMPIGSTRTYYPNSPDEFNITFENTSKVCGSGKEEMLFGGLSDAWANITTTKGDQTESQILTAGSSTTFLNYTLNLQFLDCRPTGHQYNWLANGTTNAQGTGSATFNTTQLNDTTSLDHSLEVRVIKNGKTVTQFTGFMLKTFDLNTWFKGKEGWEPAFTPSENMTLEAKTVKKGITYPGVNVTLAGVWKSCSGGNGPNQGGTGGTGGGGSPGPGPTGETAPGGNSGGGMMCEPPIQIDEYLGTTDSNGLLEANINKSKYNITSGSYELILKGTDADGNMAVANLPFSLSPFTVTLTPEAASQGEPITVAIASTYVNGTVDIIETRYTPSPMNVTLTNGTLDETGAGSIIINTQSLNPGFHQITIVVTYNESGNLTTATKSTGFMINAYSLAVELDKQSYGPGRNVTVAVTATRGGYGYQGVQVQSAALYQMGVFGPGTWIALSNVTTGPTGQATFTFQAPAEKGDWSLQVMTTDPSWNPASEWAMFKVADAQINITTSSQILNLGDVLQVNATTSSDTLTGTTNMTFFLWKIYDPSTGMVLQDSNITVKACYNKTVVAINTTTAFNCTVNSLGMYLGIVVLGNTALAVDSTTLDDMAGSSADAGYIPPEISVWVRNNQNITAVESQGRSQLNASTATSPQDLTFNFTSNQTVWMPFMIESKYPFPANFMKAMMKSLDTKQEDILFNATANLTEQAPDTSGDIYYLFLFTDTDLTASELFGGEGVPGDLARLVDIREVKITYAQAAANLKITSPTQGQTVTDDYTYVTVQKGGNLSAVAGTKVRMDNGANRTYSEGMHLWDFNLTNGNHTLYAWFVNSTNGTIPGTLANVTFTLNRTFCGQSCGGGNYTPPGNGTGNQSAGVNITIISPADLGAVNSSTVDVYYAITTGLGKVTHVYSKLDSDAPSQVSSWNSSGYVRFSSLTNGAHNVTLLAMNGTSFPANILGSDSVLFFVNASQPGNGSGNGTGPMLSGRIAQQAGSPISGAGLTFHSEPVNVTTDANGTYNLSLGLGIHNISVTYAGYAEITGTFNLTSNASLNLTMWRISPISVNAVPQAPGEINVTVVLQNLEDLTINGTQSGTLVKNGIPYPQNTTSFLLQPLNNTSINFMDYYNTSLGVPDLVEVEAQGNANGTASGMSGLNVKFKVHQQMNISGGDGGPISLELISPANNSNVSVNFTTVNYTITGNWSKVSNISYAILNNGANVTLAKPSSNVSSFNLTGLSQGTNLIAVFIKNSTGGDMGAPAMLTLNVIGGGQGPEQFAINITSPANNANVSANFTVNYTITGNLTKISNVSYAINGGNETFLQQPASNISSFNITNQSPGPTSVVVYLKNATNGTMAPPAMVNLTVTGGQGPGQLSVNITSPANNSNVNENVTVNYSITGNYSQVSNISYRTYQGAPAGNYTFLQQPATANGSFTIFGLSAGLRTIELALMNASQQPMAQSAKVSVNVSGGAPQQPSITITSPANNSAIAANNFIILYNITGNTSQVKYLGFAIDNSITSELYQNQTTGNHSYSSLPPISHVVQVFLLNASVSSMPPPQGNIVAPQAQIIVNTTVP